MFLGASIKLTVCSWGWKGNGSWRRGNYGSSAQGERWSQRMGGSQTHHQEERSAQQAQRQWQAQVDEQQRRVKFLIPIMHLLWSWVDGPLHLTSLSHCKGKTLMTIHEIPRASARFVLYIGFHEIQCFWLPSGFGQPRQIISRGFRARIALVLKAERDILENLLEWVFNRQCQIAIRGSQAAVYISQRFLSFFRVGLYKKYEITAGSSNLGDWNVRLRVQSFRLHSD